MTGSVALDVVIGLVFVYTLYSLLTTTFTEFIATWIRLRSMFLIRGIERMLDDGSGTKIFSSIFMAQPLIKYLTANGAKFYKAPAYMSAANFSKNLFETLKAAYPLKAMEKVIAILKTVKDESEDWQNFIKEIEKETVTSKQVDEGDLKKIRQKIANMDTKKYPDLATKIEDLLVGIEAHETMKPLDRIREVLDLKKNLIGKSETIKHIRSLLEDANGDLEKFKAYLEQWYDDTMERVTGWYKKWIQVITFFVGFLVAIFFNADTILIVDMLAKDPDAREQMVQMATTYIENHPTPPLADTTDAAKDTRKKLDSLLTATKDIKKDVESANSVLGLGWNFPDSIELLSPNNDKVKIFKGKVPPADKFLPVYLDEVKDANLRYIEFNNVVTARIAGRLLDLEKDKGHVIVENEDNIDKNYVSVSFTHFIWSGFWGYFLTAVALSLGAPFWFDLLNKLVKLRTSVQSSPSETSSQSATATTAVPVTKRVG